MYTPSSLSCSSQHWCSRPFPSSVALLCTHSTPQCLSCTEGPDLDTALEVWPHQCPAQGDNPCPAPAGHTIADPGQDAIALLGPWAHPGSRSAAGTSTPRSFPATLSQPVALPGAAVTQGQDPALGLVEPHTIGLSPWIQPGQIPLQSLPALQQTNTPSQLGVICKLTECTQTLIKVSHGDIKQNSTSNEIKYIKCATGTLLHVA
ncbi:hypothetical protein DUI87_28116 [Hirundo rustica rustica]|uniref:Uncharacterized protein n=1 Tax=Hirundo rustica rustica TaxID=333673 RepID=A0A3M0J3L9_HIRRU|nr:hypothetical protein DUI87_28116 [Hirundo rustica rustica]